MHACSWMDTAIYWRGVHVRLFICSHRTLLNHINELNWVKVINTSQGELPCSVMENDNAPIPLHTLSKSRCGHLTGLEADTTSDDSWMVMLVQWTVIMTMLYGSSQYVSGHWTKSNMDSFICVKAYYCPFCHKAMASSVHMDIENEPFKFNYMVVPDQGEGALSVLVGRGEPNMLA